MEKLDRRKFLRLGGAALAMAAVSLPSREASAAETIRPTYSYENREQAFAAGRELYEKLLAKNPDIKEKLKNYAFSMSDVRGGARNAMQSYEAYVIHRKDVSVENGFSTIGGATPIGPEELDKRHPGVHAVIPAEEKMNYDRFRDLFNQFAKSYQAQ